MKYALLIYEEAGALEAVGRLSEEAQQPFVDECLALRNQEPDVYRAAQLQPAESATTVRMKDTKTLITDGPFADTKEVLGGVWLFEADNVDAALELAARIPAVRLGGVVEVRPIVER